MARYVKRGMDVSAIKAAAAVTVAGATAIAMADSARTTAVSVIMIDAASKTSKKGRVLSWMFSISTAEPCRRWKGHGADM